MGARVPQLSRARLLWDRGQLVQIELPWTRTFALWPRRTLKGRWIWLRHVYHRRVWRYTGFVDEPFSEYGDLFDILAES